MGGRLASGSFPAGKIQPPEIYFFVIQNGARVADLYTSLIYTCELNGVNTFHDLMERELHAEELTEHPEEWMPWNDQAPLERINAGPPCPVQPTLSTPAEGAAAPNTPR